MSTGRIGPAILAALISDPATLLAIRTNDEGVITVFSPDELLAPCPEAVADFWRQLAEQERNKREVAEEALNIALARSGCQDSGAAELGPEPPSLREQAMDRAGEVAIGSSAQYFANEIGAAEYGRYADMKTVSSRLFDSLKNGLEIHVGAVGFNQLAVIQHPGARPFSQMPTGRYIYFPDG